MEGTAVSDMRGLERISRNLMTRTVVLAITIALLAIVDFA